MYMALQYHMHYEAKSIKKTKRGRIRCLHIQDTGILTKQNSNNKNKKKKTSGTEQELCQTEQIHSSLLKKPAITDDILVQAIKSTIQFCKQTMFREMQALYKWS